MLDILTKKLVIHFVAFLLYINLGISSEYVDHEFIKIQFTKNQKILIDAMTDIFLSYGHDVGARKCDVKEFRLQIELENMR